jgi:hypothetical protein
MVTICKWSINPITNQKPVYSRGRSTNKLRGFSPPAKTALTTLHPLSAKVGTNFAGKGRSFGRSAAVDHVTKLIVIDIGGTNVN